MRLALAVALAAMVLGTLAGGAAADSFTPVTMNVHVTPIARRGTPLRVSITVSADPAALDAGETLWMRVKLAAECGGTFTGTPGTRLIDRPLSPQPSTGHAYHGTVSGSGRPRSYGVETVCVFLETQDDDREYATSQSVTVDVSRACTRTAARYDAARRALTRARRRHRGVRAAERRVRSDRRAAARACGRGVKL